MEIVQVRGNTYYLNGWQAIPFYCVDKTHCVLLDTGTLFQRQEIETTLEQAGLTPVGILGTHIHTDHSANHRYFQQKYHIPVALPIGEAGLCLTPLHLKAYFYSMSPKQIVNDEEGSVMTVSADRVIGKDEAEVVFCETEFRILNTPGHSPGHISIYTPDNVLYLGDALLTENNITEAKLPYFFAVQKAIETMEMLRGVRADVFLAAHKGQYAEIGTIVDQDIAELNNRAEQIRQVVVCPMTADQIYAAVCQHMNLRTSKLKTAALLERNMRSYLEYLRDIGQLALTVQNGVLHYEQV